MFEDLLTSFVTFFTVIDPIGTIPVFIAVTSGVKADKRKKMAMFHTYSLYWNLEYESILPIAKISYKTKEKCCHCYSQAQHESNSYIKINFPINLLSIRLIIILTIIMYDE